MAAFFQNSVADEKVMHEWDVGEWWDVVAALIMMHVSFRE